ncbi:RAMP superfamily protein [Nostoc sp. FACHB-87]|uniref:RAMP superfamily CRISPR-associated protein n=1 Tax=Nostocaceae TaxID=1162 RepID=UPI0016870A21|nr:MULTISPECIES: RAMP superfamily CRISPR-associated protein [Nostocaceae]MBD2454066.1 RAMP superfamily protein [Nostoc sp. FACHB-87]MBD2476239.1 RAMP superfamily protein [Anabaena sp. FACHB-83]
MIIYKLKITLLSDTTFGRGDGVAGVIDQEVEHDAYGFPYLRGRTLKGLLSEEADNLIGVLPEDISSYWENIACTLFGIPGSSLESIGIMHVGDACLPEDLRTAVAWQIKNEELTSNEILDSLTTIRRQTAINSQIGVAEEGSLRSFRVVIRQLEFQADLIFETQPSDEILSLLSASTLALRRIGSGRNRGRGHIKCTLHYISGKDITHDYLNLFGKVEEKV